MDIQRYKRRKYADPTYLLSWPAATIRITFCGMRRRAVPCAMKPRILCAACRQCRRRFFSKLPQFNDLQKDAGSSRWKNGFPRDPDAGRRCLDGSVAAPPTFRSRRRTAFRSSLKGCAYGYDYALMEWRLSISRRDTVCSAPVGIKRRQPSDRLPGSLCAHHRAFGVVTAELPPQSLEDALRRMTISCSRASMPFKSTREAGEASVSMVTSIESNCPPVCSAAHSPTSSRIALPSMKTVPGLQSADR